MFLKHWERKTNKHRQIALLARSKLNKVSGHQSIRATDDRSAE